jgi:hypothetical protein
MSRRTCDVRHRKGRDARLERARGSIAFNNYKKAAPPMAKMCPTIRARLASSAGLQAELDLLHTLERDLSDAYTLFHSVDCSRGAGEMEQHGEIDIVVINQSGEVLLIEVKSGNVDFRPDGIFKTYGTSSKDVTAQAKLQFGALLSRMRDAQLDVQLRHLLVFPDMQVQSQTVQWPRERIVDSADMAHVVARVVLALGPGACGGRTFEHVLAFFENRFRVEPHVSALAGRLKVVATRMSSGLATWVPRNRSTVRCHQSHRHGRVGQDSTGVAIAA